ncbi:MAG: hypothetical protein ACRCW3_03010, partial [Metamycoplasmataceae bacterium]
NIRVIKGLVRQKMQISPWFTHPQLILGVPYMTFFFQTNTIGVTLKNVLSLPSFIMAVNGSPKFEAQKSASIHY